MKTSPILFSTFKDSYKINVGMESDKEVVSRLKFIGKVQKGEKINIQNFTVQPQSLSTKLVRTFLIHDNRLNTLNFIRITINKAFEIINDYLASEQTIKKHLCRNIIKDLIQSKQGIYNIRETYFDDIKFCCDIDVLIENVDATLLNIQKKISINSDDEVEID